MRSRRVLMIAFHVPPYRDSSGMLRTLKFSQYLLEHEWMPVILAPHTRAYAALGSEFPKNYPNQIEVHRAFALDTARHLAVNGTYLGWLALPDRWNSWLLGAIPAGLSLIRKYRPEIIWSTYPVPTAHLIGWALNRITGIPWIADFRDPMVYESWPTQPAQRKVHSWVERMVVRNCRHAVFTTPGALRLYRERYPQLPETRWKLIPNGYDEADFPYANAKASLPKGPVFLLHSGLMEIPDRDPSAFFWAVAELRARNEISSANLRVVLRASGEEENFKRKIKDCEIGDIVSLEPRIAYADALSEMMSADGLLLFQGPDCNRQIPAKAYEYLALGKPVLGLVDPEGDTSALLREAGVTTLASMTSRQEIAQILRHFLSGIRSGNVKRPNLAAIAQYSRRSRAAELARLFDSVVGT
ncbi:MAG TPA: glycosyltransferase [Candidatus Binatia bacterium]|nr:glycosyltransferase [Candidatus Binatia bacterium]